MSEEKKLPPREGKVSGEIRMRSPLLAKLDNFWYHYKWPFLIGVFALVVLTVCLVQCVRNGKDNDAYMLYAGGTPLSVNGYRELEASMEPFLEDLDGDDRRIVAIQSYPIYTQDEVMSFKDSDSRARAAEMSSQNTTAFQQDADATLCFLSEWLFIKEAEAGGLIPLSELISALPEGAEAVSVGGVAYGVRLSTLPIYALPGFSEMDGQGEWKKPGYTVICVRRRPVYAEEELHEANCRLFARLVEAK